MFLSNASIRRPVAMCALIIALTLLGLNSYRDMGLEHLPKVDLPYITIVTVYPGGTPEEIETEIAKPIEDQMVSLDGLKHVTITSMENACQVLLEFHLDVNVDIAATDVREKLDLIVNDFPEGTEKPKVLKYDVNAKPIINIALTGSPAIDALYDYADNTLRDRLTVISGVATVELIGGAEREVHVLLDREKLAGRGLTSVDVVQAIRGGVRTIPSGNVRESGTEYSVKFDADYRKVENIGYLEVINREGKRCYLKDIGEVRMETEERRQAAYIDGRAAIGIKIIKKADANAVRVVERVRAELEKVRGSLPGGMELIWITDDGTFTEAEVNSTIANIWQGVVLTALILFFFLYSFRSTLIVAATMPLTIIISLFFLSLIGYTLNVSTLLALGLSVGILVTNSIVVLESMVKRIERSGNVKESAKLGAGEVAVAVAASAGTNIVVLFPVYMMGSMVGLFFGPFAMTLVIVTAVSLFISFTLTPILASVLLKPEDTESKSLLKRMERLWNRFFDRVSGAFAATLRTFERNRPLALLFLAGVIAFFLFSLWIAQDIGLGFFPEADRGEAFVKLEYPTNYDLDHTVSRVQEVEKRLEDMPYLQHVFTTVGKVENTIGRTSEGVYLAQILLRFCEKTARDISLERLMEMARERLQGYADCLVIITQASAIGGQSTPIELDIYGDEFDELDRLALAVQEQAEQIPGFVEPDTSVRHGKPELRVTPDRPVLADLQVPATGVGMALRGNLEGLEAGAFKRGARSYDIVVKMREREGKDQVREFPFPGAPGKPVVMSGITDIEETVSPVKVLRKNKRRMSKLFSSLTAKKPMSTAVEELNEAIRENVQTPPGYDYFYSGEYELMEEANAEFAEAGLIAIVLVYLLLAAILESFKQPFIILATLPLGMIGMIWALYFSGESFSMFVILAAVMLIGIVVNNAILIMDRLNQNVRNGMGRHEAMVDAAAERFRPIVMITLAAVLGMLPLAVSQGLGSEHRNGIGIASVGGIAVSALLTLVVLPVIYDLFTRGGKKKEKH
jgi:hydrophobic/amphiphilic exporter-1 (mainly G- bacteria), HAE1 family